MVEQFPQDYMHSCCLGVMRRLLKMWIKGKRGRNYSVAPRYRQLLSKKLLRLRRFMPTCFQRRPRGVDELDFWKATELRQFLLYTGKIVLKGILPDDQYEHFVAFSVALCILVSPTLLSEYAEYADELLTYVVGRSKELYGTGFMVYNVHILEHLAADAVRYGGLDNCSAFPYENHLQVVKSLVRSGNNPVSQIVRRLRERVNCQVVPREKTSGIDRRAPDNGFVLKDGRLIEVVERANQRGYVMARVFTDPKPLFEDPMDSRVIGVYSLNRYGKCGF